jgi:hypothetical protein
MQHLALATDGFKTAPKIFRLYLPFLRGLFRRHPDLSNSGAGRLYPSQLVSYQESTCAVRHMGFLGVRWRAPSGNRT